MKLNIIIEVKDSGERYVAENKLSSFYRLGSLGASITSLFFKTFCIHFQVFPHAVLANIFIKHHRKSIF